MLGVYSHFVLIQLLIHFNLCPTRVQASSRQFQPIFNQDAAIRHAKAADIRKFMNTSLNPCRDFYEYACSNWGKYHVRGTTSFQLLHSSIDNNLIRLLDEETRLEDSSLTRKAKDFYKSCLRAERNGQAQQLFLSEFINNNGGFPAVPGSNWHVHHHNYQWLEVVAQLRKNYGMDIMIGLRIDLNYANVQENSIYLGEPSTLIPTKFCNANASKLVDKRYQEYEQIEKNVAENLQYWLALGRTEAKYVAADIVSFEYALCAGMQRQETIPTTEESLFMAKYVRKNVIQFTHQYDDKLNLNDFMTNSFGAPIYMPVYMTAPDYFSHLIKTVTEFNITIIANYIMYRAISMLTFPLDDQPNRRSNYCLKLSKRYFAKALSELYQDQYASETTKTDISAMYTKVKESFEQSLHSDWLEDGTSRIGIRKLTDIMLNFPEYERQKTTNLHIDIDNYWNNLAAVMGHIQSLELQRIFETNPEPSDKIQAYESRLCYRPVHKHIDISWGLLQPPYYHTLYGHAINYATVAYKLGEQLAIAFDDIHWALNIFELNSWDAWTAAGYRNRSHCFRTQISNYLHNNPKIFNNATQLRQFITNSVGLNIAFKAYLTWLNFQSPNNDFTLLSKETLPELNFTNTQLFFIAFAQSHCVTEERPHDQHQQLLTYSAQQKHTLQRYAVNGPLRNSMEFSKEFNCKVGAPMNPADKCVIY